MTESLYCLNWLILGWKEGDRSERCKWTSLVTARRGNFSCGVLRVGNVWGRNPMGRFKCHQCMGDGGSESAGADGLAGIGEEGFDIFSLFPLLPTCHPRRLLVAMLVSPLVLI